MVGKISKFKNTTSLRDDPSQRILGNYSTSSTSSPHPSVIEKQIG